MQVYGLWSGILQEGGRDTSEMNQQYEAYKSRLEQFAQSQPKGTQYAKEELDPNCGMWAHSSKDSDPYMQRTRENTVVEQINLTPGEKQKAQDLAERESRNLAPWPKTPYNDGPMEEFRDEGTPLG